MAMNATKAKMLSEQPIKGQAKSDSGLEGRNTAGVGTAVAAGVGAGVGDGVEASVGVGAGVGAGVGPGVGSAIVVVVAHAGPEPMKPSSAE